MSQPKILVSPWLLAAAAGLAVLLALQVALLGGEAASWLTALPLLVALVLLRRVDWQVISVPLLILAFMLSPGFPVVEGLPPIRAEDPLIVFLMLMLLLRSLLMKRNAVNPDPVTLVLSLMLVSVIISILIAAMVLEIRPDPRDFAIVPQIIKYMMIFLVAKSLEVDEKFFARLLTAVMVAGMIAALFGIFQYDNTFEVNDWLTPAYNTNEEYTTALVYGFYNRRITGTTGNANYYGNLLAGAFAFVTAALLFAPRRKQQALALAALLLVGVAAGLTLSRSTLIGFFMLFVSAIFMNFTCKLNMARGARYLGMGVMAVMVFLTYFASEGFEARVTLSDAKEHGSLEARIRDLVEPFEEAMESPVLLLVGQGPSKSTLRTDSHNGFGWYFKRFGLLGLALYSVLLIMILQYAFHAFRRSTTWWENGLYLAGFLVMVNWLMGEFGGNIFKNPQNSAFNFFVAGLLFAAARQKAAQALETTQPAQERQAAA